MWNMKFVALPDQTGKGEVSSVHHRKGNSAPYEARSIL
jgi:hypothetical protein